LIFLRDGVLLGVPYELGETQVTGRPFPIAAAQGTNESVEMIDASPGGTVAYLTRASSIERRQIVSIDSTGTVTPITQGTGSIWLLHDFDPDGRKIFLSTSSPSGVNSLGIYDRLGNFWTYREGTILRSTWDKFQEDLIVATLGQRGQSRLEGISLDDNGETRSILPDSLAQNSIPIAVSDDSQHLVLIRSNDPFSPGDLWAVSLYELEKREVLAREVSHADVTSDFKWIVYSSRETGNSEVYVQSLEDTERKFRISEAGGNHPQWIPDSFTVLYTDNNSNLMSVTIETEPEFRTVSSSARYSLQNKNLVDLPFLVDPQTSNLYFIQRQPEADTGEQVQMILNLSQDLEKRDAEAGR
ncbi:MAG: hypothetical protein HKN21_16225, partial [Candidatus Eisenbacteria bacterium]|nr:hypothetical protein [Candidatus Eisenbacteria bacterium]